MQEFIQKLNNPKTYLLLANILLVFFLILLFNLGVLPIKDLGDFAFFTVIYLAFALYRPGWSFLFFIGTIALENINLAPKGIGIMVRPYQFIGGLTILAVLIKLAVRRLGFKLPKWNWSDLLFVIFAAAGFISAFGATDKSIAFKQSIIALSFVVLYFLARIFIQNLDDLKKAAPFFLSSSVIVMLYGLWQNIRFMLGADPFEFMPGRPNSTFSEADWYGIYLSLLLAIIYVLIFYFNKKHYDFNKDAQISNFQFPISNQIQNPKSEIQKLPVAGYWLLVTLTFISLILTVSRSAWLGAFAVTFAFLFFILTSSHSERSEESRKISTSRINTRSFASLRMTTIFKWAWKYFGKQFFYVVISVVLSCGIIYIFHLTNFQLFNRAQSTGSGLQKITVLCLSKSDFDRLPEKISDVSELSKYDCRHINLEDISKEQAEGNFVTTIYRPDPNVNIRGQIYKTSWEQIKEHPIFGIGWGNIGNILGKDENGNTLNSSNIFLEVWLGTGLLGITAFVLVWIWIIIKSILYFVSEGDSKAKNLGLFLFLGSVAFIIPDMFNAGIFIDAMWVFFAINSINYRHV